MSPRISVGGLMERQDLCLVEVLGFDWQPGHACGILTKFGQAEIPLSYLSIGQGVNGDVNMSFCVRTEQLSAHRGLIQEIEAEFSPRRVATNAPVVIFTLYGPHFLERHALAAEVFSALCSDSIRALSVNSSVNSISVVVDLLDRDRTHRCLRDRFEWPE